LIGAGVGITPLMAIVRYLADRSWAGDIHLIIGARRKRDVIFAAELERLQTKLSNLHVVVTLSGEEEGQWIGARGRISSALLRAAVPDLGRLPVYLCGPDAMMAETTSHLLALGVPPARIKTEAFVSTPAVAVEKSGIGRAMPAHADVPAVEATAGLADQGVAMVHFRRSMTVVELPPDKTILEAAEEAGLALPFECRSGICGQCKTRLLAGSVTMDADDALSAGDRDEGIILACQARSSSNVAVDA
jgi:ferredoxin-NADP reductase